MARYIHQGWAFDGNGKLVGGATVAVFLAGTSTVASIYTAATGGVAVNSITSSTTDGSWCFYVDSSDYDHSQKFKTTITKTGFTSKTVDNVVIFSSALYGNYNVEDYGAVGDGSTDDSIPIQAAIDAAYNVGGGVVLFGPRTYLCNIVIPSYVTLKGSGVYSTVLKSVNSSDEDVIKGKDFDTLTGTAKETLETRGANYTSIRDLTIDGNKANNSSGFGIRVWGLGMVWQNIYVINCSEDGIFTEFTTHDTPTGADNEDPRSYDIASFFYNIHSSGNGGNGWTYKGPHDGTVSRYESFANDGWAFYQTGTYSSMQYGSSWNSWLNTTGSYYFQTGGKFYGLVASADYLGTGIELASGIGSVQILSSIVSGHITGIIVRGDSNYIQAQVLKCRNHATESSATLGDGVEIDEAINCTVDVWGDGNHNAIKIVSEVGSNKIHGRFNVTAGKTLLSGTPSGNDDVLLYDYIARTFIRHSYNYGGNQIGTLADSATPSIDGGIYWITGGTTTITNLTDGITGTVVTIISEHSITITDGTNIFLNGSANFVMSATDTLTLICKADGLWYEIARSDNT